MLMLYSDDLCINCDHSENLLHHNDGNWYVAYSQNKGIT